MVKVLSFKFQHIWLRFPCCFSKDPLRRDILDVDLTMFFGVHNIGNISAMTVIEILKIFKIETRFQKCNKKNVEKFFVFERIPSELAALSCLY